MFGSCLYCILTIKYSLQYSLRPAYKDLLLLKLLFLSAQGMFFNLHSINLYLLNAWLISSDPPIYPVVSYLNSDCSTNTCSKRLLTTTELLCVQYSPLTLLPSHSSTSLSLSLNLQGHVIGTPLLNVSGTVTCQLQDERFKKW